MTKLEKDLETKVRKYVESLGGQCIKLRDEARRGFPDRTILLPGGKVLFLELKKPKNKPSPHQLRRIDELSQLRFSALWGDNFEQIKNYISHVMDMPRIP